MGRQHTSVDSLGWDLPQALPGPRRRKPPSGAVPLPAVVTVLTAGGEIHDQFHHCRAPDRPAVPQWRRLGGLFLIGNGLSKTVYFERTPNAVSGAREGNLLLAGGCAVLIMCAAVVISTGPRWAAAAMAVPAVLCGGVAMTASGAFLPQIAALPTIALAIAGAVGVLAKRGMG